MVSFFLGLAFLLLPCVIYMVFLLYVSLSTYTPFLGVTCRVWITVTS